MAAIIHPLESLLVSPTRQELAAQQVTYLKAVNQILWSCKVPKRIELSDQERR